MLPTVIGRHVETRRATVIEVSAERRDFFMRTLAAVFAASVLATAQIGTSTITGRVVDSSGAVVPNVNVTVLHKATNVSSVAVTNNEGIFRVPSLNVGEYRVSFEAPGFKKSVVETV